MNITPTYHATTLRTPPDQEIDWKCDCVATHSQCVVKARGWYLARDEAMCRMGCAIHEVTCTPVERTRCCDEATAVKPRRVTGLRKGKR